MKIIDNDLTFEYSKVISIKQPANKNITVSYNKNLQTLDIQGIEYESIYNVSVFDTQGKLVCERKNNFQLPIFLDYGIYFIQIMDSEGNISTNKIGL